MWRPVHADKFPAYVISIAAPGCNAKDAGQSHKANIVEKIAVLMACQVRVLISLVEIGE